MAPVTIDEAIQKYGHIDFESKIWPDQAKHMSMLKLDGTKFPNWHVTGTEYHVHAIYCNNDIQEPLTKALNLICAMGLAHKLITFDGCFNIRMVRGNPRQPSAHAYGLALDINADTNKLGQTTGGFFNEPDLVRAFTLNGFNWGGHFHSRKDPMHYSFCGWERS